MNRLDPDVRPLPRAGLSRRSLLANLTLGLGAAALSPALSMRRAWAGVSDPSFLLNYLFYGRAPPPDPGPAPGACGDGPAGSPLSCIAFDACG